MMCQATRRSCFLGIFFAGVCLSGCVAPYPEEEYSLYEDYDVKTVTSKPEKARSVDDMLGIKPRPVHKIETQKADENAAKAPEQEKPAVKTTILSTKDAVKNSPDVKGRFGSKEKRFLRKGLNAPADSMQYDQTITRTEIVVVRGLAVQPLSKTEEQKILNDIVASQNLATAEEKKTPEKTKTPEKEVVKTQIKESAPKEQNKEVATVTIQKSEKPAVPAVVIMPAQTKQASVAVNTQTEPLPVVKEVEKQPDFLVEPVNLTAPLPQEETPVFDTQMPLISAPAKEKYTPATQERIILKAPSEKVVLVPPESVKENNAAPPRIEIYLED